MSHGATPVTRATMSTPKGGLSQAEVWEKVSHLQAGLKEFSILFVSLQSALRSTSPSKKTWNSSLG